MKPGRKGNLKQNITKNLKTIEWLKAELIEGVSSLFKAMIPNNEKRIIRALVRMVIAAYTLGSRLGISFERLEDEMDEQVQELIDDQHEIEEWFGELSKLKEHLDGKNNF